jgi:hypothetical protein
MGGAFRVTVLRHRSTYSSRLLGQIDIFITPIDGLQLTQSLSMLKQISWNQNCREIDHRPECTLQPLVLSM